MSGSRVQVLTLAELAFTIVFALIIISLSEGQRTATLLDAAAEKLAAATHTIEDANNRINELEAGLARVDERTRK